MEERSRKRRWGKKPLSHSYQQMSGAGYFACPPGKACRLALVKGKITYEEYAHDTGSKWISFNPCANAVLFGGKFFCRRFMENGLGKRSV